MKEERGHDRNKEKNSAVMKAENPKVGELDQYLFGQGTHYSIYKKLGAHLTKQHGQGGRLFCGLGAQCQGSQRGGRV